MFAPYAIKHIQLSELKSLSPPRGNHYLVFWYRHFPLGHLWYDQPCDQRDFERRVAEAIVSTLDHYAGSVGNQKRDWHRMLFDADSLDQQLEHLLVDLPYPNQITQPITVVICTRNRPKELGKCVEQLRRSNDLDFELLVVDNASDTDETRRIVAGFDGVRYVREERKGLDIARNTGIRHAKHAIVAFTDDDVTVDPDWITRIKEGFADPLIMALTGLTIPAEIETQAQYVFETEWGFNKGYLPKLFDPEYVKGLKGAVIPAWDVGAGANMAFRKDIFKIVGGFDERLDVGASGCSGDSEMWYRILAEGWNCLYLPQVVVYHQHRKTMAELDKQLHAYMKGHVSALLVQHEKYGHRNNIRRIKRDLPLLYAKRLYWSLRSLNRPSIRSLFTEVSGCIAGWRFYGANPVNRDASLFDTPKQIRYRNAIADDTLVSVVITCYNYGRFLGDVIESVRKQIHKHIQIIVVDDGSTDQTADVCAVYPEVEYVRTQHVGVSNARNAGILYCKGEYVLFLDADDLLYPDALAIQLYYFNYYPELAFVAGGFDRIDQGGNLLLNQPPQEQRKDDFYHRLLMGNFIGMQSNTLYRRDLFFDFYFDSRLDGCEDYDLNLRISRYLPAFFYPQKTAAYRVHPNSLSSDATRMRSQVLKALSNQIPFLHTPEDKAAYEAGLTNWTEYYQSLQIK